MSESIIDTVAFTVLSQATFQSNQAPDYYGGFDPRVGFGGWSIAFGINIAAATVDPAHNVYSVMGNFLRAANNTDKVHGKVTTLRNTKTFATRRVELSQGEVYMCLTVDFTKPAKESLLTYSRGPRYSYPPVTESLTVEEQHKIAQERGVDAKGFKQWQRRFGAKARKFQSRAPRDTLLAQILSGITEGWPDRHFDPLPMPEKALCEYIQHRLPLKSHLENVLAIAYVLDTAMPFTPMLASKLPFAKVAAAGSLDFALRIFTNQLNLNEWHMTEETTMVAAESRTYSEARMWDEKGRLVASMTEQCILKPRPAKL